MGRLLEAGTWWLAQIHEGVEALLLLVLGTSAVIVVPALFVWVFELFLRFQREFPPEGRLERIAGWMFWGSVAALLISSGALLVLPHP